MYIAKNIADLRKEPEPRSERVSQALLNTNLGLEEEKEDWSLLETPEGFTGWVRNNYLSEKIRREGPRWRVKNLFAPVLTSDEGSLYSKITFNTVIYGEKEEEYVTTTWPEGQNLKIPKKYLEPADKNKDFEGIGELAKRFLGTPYLWGGISPFGLDCSGFVQTLFDYLGKTLPRNSDKQKEEGRKVTDSSDKETLKDKPELGDLLFFPGHVGMYLKDGRMIHSCSHENGVAITDLTDDSDYSSYLRDEMTVIKRLID